MFSVGSILEQNWSIGRCATCQLCCGVEWSAGSCDNDRELESHNGCVVMHMETKFTAIFCWLALIVVKHTFNKYWQLHLDLNTKCSSSLVLNRWVMTH